MSPLLDPPPADATEKAFMARVVALAEANRWRAHHQYDSRRSAAGWPDLVLVRGPVMILSELKSNSGRLSDAQKEWLEALREVPGVRVRIWKPSLWSAIVCELTG